MSIKATVKPTIFREYIGMKPYPDKLCDFPVEIINPKIPEFHFILGFATENYDENGRGMGNFKRTWNVDYFSPEKVKKLKQKFDNVKVVISIGGRGPENPFNPAEKDVWPENAIGSLKEIIQYYNSVKDLSSYHNIIDGIDINYEDIKSSDTDFARCIGKVINGLKKHVPINVVSIAPSDLVSSYYVRLYQEYQHQIDWVDYQFYDQTVSSKGEFVNIYRCLTHDYDVHKLLAGVSTDPDDASKMSREVFIEGCTNLINANSLPGIFVWNANDSAVTRRNEKPFLLEEMAQKLLTKSDD